MACQPQSGLAFRRYFKLPGTPGDAVLTYIIEIDRKIMKTKGDYYRRVT